MTVVEIIITTPLGLFSVFLAILFFGWMFMVKLFPLNASAWRKLDLICIFVASIGILGILSDNRQFLCERELSEIEPRIGQYERRLMSEFDPDVYDRFFYPGLYSSKEIELIEEDYSKMSLWMKYYRDTILTVVENRILIDTTTLEYPTFNMQVSARDFRRKIDNLIPIIVEYNQLIDEYDRFKEGRKKKFFEILYDFLSPLFITIGLAYQIVRWLWENKNEAL